MSPVSPTLLLADDSATTRRVVELTFADQGLRVVSVGDGRQAIERAQQDPPDIVLADIGMPGKDGYEVAEFLRAHPRLGAVPVLLMAGAFEPADDSRVAACGAAGVLMKPLEPDIVISRVRELLRRGTTPAAPADHRLITPAVADATVEPEGPAPQHDAATDAADEGGGALAPFAASAPAATPPVVAPAPPPVNDAFADAFAALLAAEQGDGPAADPEPVAVPEPVAAALEPLAPMGRATPVVDADAIAAEVTMRVTERLVSGIGHDVVRSVAAEVAARVAREVADQVTREVVSAVAERVTRELAAGVVEQVVRDEIARIRAAAALRR